MEKNELNTFEERVIYWLSSNYKVVKNRILFTPTNNLAEAYSKFYNNNEIKNNKAFGIILTKAFVALNWKIERGTVDNKRGFYYLMETRNNITTFNTSITPVDLHVLHDKQVQQHKHVLHEQHLLHVIQDLETKVKELEKVKNTYVSEKHVLQDLHVQHVVGSPEKKGCNTSITNTSLTSPTSTNTCVTSITSAKNSLDKNSNELTQTRVIMDNVEYWLQNSCEYTPLNAEEYTYLHILIENFCLKYLDNNQLNKNLIKTLKNHILLVGNTIWPDAKLTFEDIKHKKNTTFIRYLKLKK